MRFSSSPASSSVRSGVLFSNAALQRSSSSYSRSSSGLFCFLRSFSRRSSRFSTATRSLRISSISTSSRSRIGSTLPFSCGTVSLSNTRSTCARASTTRRLARYAGSRRASLEIDGKSRYSTVACVIFGGSKIFASSSRRGSGTRVTPTRVSIEPTRAASCTPVRMVKRDVLPTIGRPIIAVFIVILRLRRPPVRSQGHGDLGQNVLQYALARFGAALRQRGAGVHRDAMGEYGNDQPLHVIGDYVIAAFYHRQSLSRPIERLSASRADAKRQAFVRARSLDNGQGVIDNRVVDRHAAHAGLKHQ